MTRSFFAALIGFIAIVLGNTPSSAQMAYITNEDNTVSVIDTATDTVSATIPVPFTHVEDGVAVTPDGSKVYVTNYFANTVLERHPNELRDCKSVFSDALNNPIITRLHQQYWELVAREADFSVRYGKDHPAVVVIRNQMHDIRNSAVNELRRLAESENCPID